jgi:hypothetical protein
LVLQDEEGMTGETGLLFNEGYSDNWLIEDENGERKEILIQEVLPDGDISWRE